MIDLLFIHVPKFNDRVEGMGETMFINLISSGVFAMAGFLEREGFRSRILHLGVEWILRGKFDPAEIIEKWKPAAVAMPLQWHHQSYDVIETAGKIKGVFPEIPIILGGLTGGYFAGEILEKYPFIDFVIEGDGEVPLRELMDFLKKGKLRYSSQHGKWVIDGSAGSVQDVLSNIPNLYFNLNNFKESIVDDTFLGSDQKIVRSWKSYFTSPEMFNSFNYQRFDLLMDFEFYRDKMGIPPVWLKEGDQERLDGINKLFFPVTGRGCPHQCTWCGKDRRDRPVFRNRDVVVDSIIEAAKAGFENLYFTFDPHPGSDRYYIELFREMRDAGIDMFVYFECWGLPSFDLISQFSETFRDGVIALSPESGSEKVRRLNKGIYYSNDDLERTLKFAENAGVEVDLFFSAGIPGEDRELFEETRLMMKYLKSSYKNIGEICLFTVEMEPGSPWFEDPGKFGIVSGRKCFEDYYNAHVPGGKGSYAAMGYYMPGYFGEGKRGCSVDFFEEEMGKLRNEIMGGDFFLPRRGELTTEVRRTQSEEEEKESAADRRR